MKDPFLEEQWQEIKQRLRACAEHHAAGDDGLLQRFQSDIARYEQQDVPPRYPHLLQRVREAAETALKWRGVERNGQPEEPQDRDSRALLPAGQVPAEDRLSDSRE